LTLGAKLKDQSAYFAFFLSSHLSHEKKTEKREIGEKERETPKRKKNCVIGVKF